MTCINSNNKIFLGVGGKKREEIKREKHRKREQELEKQKKKMEKGEKQNSLQ